MLWVVTALGCSDADGGGNAGAGGAPSGGAAPNGGAGGAGGAGGGGPSCGDGVCAATETCASCEADCGSCCGDEVCGDNELCGTCPSDCGACTGVAPTVTRGPYLQRGSSSGVVVRFRTAEPSDSVVAFGLDPSNLSQVVKLDESTTEHEVVLPNLSPDTRYYYGFGKADAPLLGADADHSVLTAPVAGTPRASRIWVLGDSGTANQNARDVRDAYLAFTGARGTDLVLMLGDNAYSDGTDDEYQAAVFDMYPTVLRNVVMYPTLGNHDGHSASSATESGPYYDMFTMPREAEAGGVPSGTEAYYSFDYGNIHFVCLDSYDSDRDPDGDMLTWLASDLAATQAEWLIAFFHHPPYSKGSHDSDDEGELIDMRENSLPLLESFGVDLVLSGHSHAYERTMYLHGHYGDSDSLTQAMILDAGSGSPSDDGAYVRASGSADGAVYVVAGSSGQVSGGPLNHPAMFVSLNNLGSLVLDVDGSTLSASFIDDEGGLADSFAMTK